MNLYRNAVICLLVALLVAGCATFKPTVEQYQTDFKHGLPTDQIGNWFVTARVVESQSQDEDTSYTESPVRIVLESHYAFKGDNPPRYDLIPELRIDSLVVTANRKVDTIPFVLLHQPAKYYPQGEHYLSGPALEAESKGTIPDRLPLDFGYVLMVRDPASDSLMARRRGAHTLLGTYPGMLRRWMELAYPNPFSPTTSMRYHLPDTALVQILVYNVEGKLVDTLANDTMPPGEHEVAWDADGVDSGVYFYRIMLNGVVAETKKMLLLR